MSQVSNQLSVLQSELNKTRDLTLEMAHRQKEVITPAIENLDRSLAKLTIQIAELTSWKEGWEIRFKTATTIAAILGGAIVWFADRLLNFLSNRP